VKSFRGLEAFNLVTVTITETLQYQNLAFIAELQPVKWQNIRLYEREDIAAVWDSIVPLKCASYCFLFHDPN
jgi:hypothetical protein